MPYRLYYHDDIVTVKLAGVLNPEIIKQPISSDDLLAELFAVVHSTCNKHQTAEGFTDTFVDKLSSTLDFLFLERYIYYSTYKPELLPDASRDIMIEMCATGQFIPFMINMEGINNEEIGSLVLLGIVGDRDLLITIVVNLVKFRESDAFKNQTSNIIYPIIYDSINNRIHLMYDPDIVRVEVDYSKRVEDNVSVS